MSKYDTLASQGILRAMKAQDTNRHAVSRLAGISYETFRRKLIGGSFTLEELEKIAKALKQEPVDFLTVAA